MRVSQMLHVTDQLPEAEEDFTGEGAVSRKVPMSMPHVQMSVPACLRHPLVYSSVTSKKKTVKMLFFLALCSCVLRKTHPTCPTLIEK